MPTPEQIAVNDKFIDIIAKRSGGGILGLARNFKIIDKDGSGSLGMDEFKLALKKFQVKLTPDETECLFKLYDVDNSKSLAFEEFLKGLRGKMSQQRRELTEQAFAKMDTDGSGVINFDDVKSTYDTSKHPKVLAMEATHEDIINELLNEFDGDGGNNDNQVTMQEWMDYHAGLSSNLDHDDMFGEMLSRNWGIKYVPMRKIQAIKETMRSKSKQKATANKSAKNVAKDIFKYIDINDSGSVDRKEFEAALERFGCNGMDSQELDTMFGMFDHDNSGEISYDELLQTVFEEGNKL